MQFTIVDFEKQQKKANWHKWFAWHPVIVTSQKDQKVYFIWLSGIERCYIYSMWIYRKIGEIN